MPLYEYACGRCHHHFEARQKMSDAALTTCPACHEEALVRLVSRSSFSLKGGGWYADGYGAGKSEGKSEAKSDAKSEKPATSEAKPAPKADAPAPPSSDKKD